MRNHLMFVKSKIKRNQTGFTLVEMVIVAAIVTMISGITLANFRAGEKRKRVSLASDAIITALRQAQTYTLAGKNTNNELTSCRVPQYYYVAFTYTNTFGLYAKNNCKDVSGNFLTDTIEIFPLPSNTKIVDLGLRVNGVPSVSNVLVAFYPPFGNTKVSINSGIDYSTFTGVDIMVESTDGLVGKTVKVDGISGKIGE